MSGTMSNRPGAPRRLKSIRINEISLVARPANVHAVALMTKCADTTAADLVAQQADIAARLDALQKRRSLDGAPARLLKAAAVAGDRIRAQVEGRAYSAPLPPTQVAKDAGGGARLVSKAASIAEAHRAAQQAQQRDTPPVSKANLSPAELFIQAARERARLMKDG
ncbi:hypothetical protein GXW78_12310 [Roseomonas terrae]|uniref:Uncharacterized protein n=1 Tax=Neoroseomonas terrae TaxID=424799 RepID=A0ABS5EHL1_9PROT|nr:hypothetical protein [Neoroseomonas terrae]MBR0650450.1 hypothetical protein [Neoroseomonas terrae]